MRFTDAIKVFEKYSSINNAEATVRGATGDLKRFCIYMHDPLIMEVQLDHIVEYLRVHIDMGWKRDSLMPLSIALRKFFEYWSRKGYAVVDWQSIPLIKKRDGKHRVASPETLQKLLDACSGPDIYSVRDNAMLRLLASTGMRAGELCSMNLSDVTDKLQIDEHMEIDAETMQQKMVKQYSTIIKTEKRKGILAYRRVFWYAETQEAIEKWIHQRAEFMKIFPAKEGHGDALFTTVGTSGGALNWGRRVHPNNLIIVFGRISGRAGIPRVNPHSLRHLFGNTAAQQGLNNSNISDLMGHSHLESSFVYTHLHGTQLGKAHKQVYNKKDGSSLPRSEESNKSPGIA
jgi:integrase/recombinase XerC